MNTIRIERKSPDGLTMQVWEFPLVWVNDLNFRLHKYRACVRQTTRHKWVTALFYARSVNDRIGANCISIDSVPIPDGLLDEVRERIINQIKVSVV